MARKILNLKRQKLKFYFPTKISWNPFAWLDRKAKRLPKRILFALVFFLATTVLLNLENQKMNQKVLGAKTAVTADQKAATSWEGILRERPDYRDGWIQLAATYAQLGEKQKAREALARAKILDPFNENILNFEKILEME